MSHSAEEVQKHVKVYITVFAALMVLTGVTVGASYLHLGSTAMNITLALIIAGIKGTLVAGYFMHLFTEKAIINWTLALTVVFFIVLLLVPILTELDTISLI
ncbi:MAG: hypothetical protein DWQ06_12070 [Calditrichaeota bacterium]|nr:MAG: hypothetical protein DWQ06_12070 [Calditrichota bacterium]